MGAVDRAVDQRTGQDVAVKVFSRDLAFESDMLERLKKGKSALS